MDTSDPDIRFDSAGRCNHCTDMLARRKAHAGHTPEAAKKLETLIARAKQAGRGKRYDCVLGASGGVDSSYLAYLLKECGLRPLLVHMDNGWNRQEAVRNIRHLAETLKLDYESFVLDWEEFRDLQLAFLRASVIEAETPTDMAIAGALHRVAARHGIKYIVSGGNMATEGILPAHWHYNSKDSVYIRGVYKRFGRGGRLRRFPFLGWREEVFYKFMRGIRMMYPINYVPFNKEEATQLLVDELGWQPYGGKHHESLYTRFVQSYLLPVKFGIDYRKATYSSQICDGKLTRAEAVEKLKAPVYDPAVVDHDLTYVSKKLCIPRAELEEIITLPPKTYRDYPNDQRWLERLYNLYRRLYPQEGGA